MQYARPSVDNLVNNLPNVLKSSRQFLPWNIEHNEKKVPLKADGSRWGDYRDPNTWRNFNDAIDLLNRRRAFGIGLVLPSAEQVRALPDFNLIAGLVALDGDAKRSPIAAPYDVPAHISDYVRRVNSYSEFSPSLKGLRALAFGTIPTEKQNITKSFGDGTELSLYHGGWVTLSGLSYADSAPTIEHRQDAIDRIVEELWPGLKSRTTAATNKTASQVPPRACFGERFVLDWSRTSSESRIRQFLQGWGRTPKQRRDITDTWELNRGWNHGNTPDHSMYTKRIVEEALWQRPYFGWTLQDVVDIVITFCKKNKLHWSIGRAKRQIADGQDYISQTCQRRGVNVVDFALVDHPQQIPTLTCIDAEMIREQRRPSEATLTGKMVNNLRGVSLPYLPDSLHGVDRSVDESKLSGGLRHKSAPREAVLQAIDKHTSWVKVTTLAAESGRGADAVRKQLQRLAVYGLVDRDGKGRYRKHRERQHRKLKPCGSKPIPVCGATHKERKTLSRSELSKRGWPKDLIDKIFPEAGKDYIEREIMLDNWIGHAVKARFYRVSRIKEIERQSWFEVERAKILHQGDEP